MPELLLFFIHFPPLHLVFGGGKSAIGRALESTLRNHGNTQRSISHVHSVIARYVLQYLIIIYKYREVRQYKVSDAWQGGELMRAIPRRLVCGMYLCGAPSVKS